MGPVQAERSYGRCPECGHSEFAADRVVGIIGWLSRRALEMAIRAGTNEPFRKADKLLQELTGWLVDADTLQAQVRPEVGRELTPSAVSIDSQTVKAAGQNADAPGYDGAKKLTGRKRHVSVATLGLLLAVIVTSAAVDDAAAAPQALAQLTAEQYPRLQVIWADSKYHNHKLQAWVNSVPRRLTLAKTLGIDS